MSIDHNELLEKSPLGIVICDKNQRISWCNARFLRETQLAEQQVINQLYASLPIEAIDKKAQLVQLFSESSKEEKRFHYWQDSTESPAGGKVHFFAEQRRDTNKLGLAAAKLPGAKLPKRASWVEFLDYEVSRSRRYDNPLAILKLHLVVLDKPESVAEETLHQTIKDTLTDELRWADMIGNTDHGTYLIVLPETPKVALKSLEDKLIAALNRQINFISDAINYQIVFGDACWQKHDDSQAMLKRARAKLVSQLEELLKTSD